MPCYANGDTVGPVSPYCVSLLEDLEVITFRYEYGYGARDEWQQIVSGYRILYGRMEEKDSEVITEPLTLSLKMQLQQSSSACLQATTHIHSVNGCRQWNQAVTV